MLIKMQTGNQYIDINHQSKPHSYVFCSLVLTSALWSTKFAKFWATGSRHHSRHALQEGRAWSLPLWMLKDMRSKVNPFTSRKSSFLTASSTCLKIICMDSNHIEESYTGSCFEMNEMQNNPENLNYAIGFVPVHFPSRSIQ